MKRVEPIKIDVSKPYPWQFRSKRALQYEISKTGKIELVEVRPTMVSEKSLLGWSYKFNKVITESETIAKEVDISFICLFKHGPIIMYEKITHDLDLEDYRTLVRGKSGWWQLDINERVGNFDLVVNREKGIIDMIKFSIIDTKNDKPDKLHTTTKKLASVEF